ncbi:uncharacterized protein LOC126474506 [Schistocerca serialis cubense]|uniref:uncharacterized protein LOC126474506 n=1 Tax=Schistocerca serialis cubense TaxID=2023355 RepID=UPI00214ECA25|nr:uncharacterized protein LOC126474506 [Schistocerca serialis cubense]
MRLNGDFPLVKIFWSRLTGSAAGVRGVACPLCRRSRPAPVAAVPAERRGGPGSPPSTRAAPRRGCRKHGPAGSPVCGRLAVDTDCRQQAASSAMLTPLLQLTVAAALLLTPAARSAPAWLQGSDQLRCLCTTPHCRQNGRNFCLTSNKCYTQFLYKGDGSDPVSWGCITSSTPLLCENRRPAKVPRDRWPYLECCDEEHLCNRAPLMRPPTAWLAEVRAGAANNSSSGKAGGGRQRKKHQLQQLLRRESDGEVIRRQRLEEEGEDEGEGEGEAGDAGAAAAAAVEAPPLICPRGAMVAQPLVVAITLTGLVLLFAVLGCGFRMLCQQSRYLKEVCPNRGYEKALAASTSAAAVTEVTEKNVTGDADEDGHGDAEPGAGRATPTEERREDT